jgi:hypothetical protein
LGNDCSGKSTILKILKNTLNELSNEFKEFFKTKSFKIFSKSLNIESLFGNSNALTDEWTDGVLAKIILEEIEK